MVLDLSATDRIFNWLDVPMEWRARCWQGIQRLHDHAYHDDRDFGDGMHQFHSADPLADVDFKSCTRCRVFWTCKECTTDPREPVYHIHLGR